MSTRDRAFLRSIIRKSHDISHPIGSMQIPLENTKTVQELPDPSFRVLVMQYIQHCGKGRGLDSRLISLYHAKKDISFLNVKYYILYHVYRLCYEFDAQIQFKLWVLYSSRWSSIGLLAVVACRPTSEFLSLIIIDIHYIIVSWGEARNSSYSGYRFPFNY